MKDEYTQESPGVIESYICKCGMDFFHYATITSSYMLPLTGKDASGNLIILDTKKKKKKKYNLELFLECSGDLRFAKIGRIKNECLTGYDKFFNGDAVKDIIRMPIEDILSLTLL